MTAKSHEWPGSIISAATILLCVGTAEFGCGAAAEPAPLPDSVSADAMLIARGLVNVGDSARLQRVMIRASQGNPVTVAVIGGSITAGAAATQPEKRYGNRVAQWWRQKFPAAQIKFVNAGIGATGSDYGALRADRDLLSKQPDIVVIEYCAESITAVLDPVLRDLPPKATLPAVKVLPAPLFSDLFERVALYEADALRPVVNRGWAYDPKLTAWKSEEPGSVIEFDVEGRVVFTMHYVVKGPMGRTRVSIDGKEERELEGWFDQTWGGYRQLNEVARWQEAGKRRVRFELLEAKDRGNQFYILGLGTAGLRSPSQPPPLNQPLSNP